MILSLRFILKPASRPTNQSALTTTSNLDSHPDSHPSLQKFLPSTLLSLACGHGHCGISTMYPHLGSQGRYCQYCCHIGSGGKSQNDIRSKIFGALSLDHFDGQSFFYFFDAHFCGNLLYTHWTFGWNFGNRSTHHHHWIDCLCCVLS